MAEIEVLSSSGIWLLWDRVSADKIAVEVVRAYAVWDVIRITKMNGAI